MKAAIFAAIAMSFFAAIVAVSASITGGGTAIAAPLEKVTICHFTESDKKPAHEIEVSLNSVALNKHLKHGDFIVDEDNPFCPALEEADLTITKFCPATLVGPFVIRVVDEDGLTVGGASLTCGQSSAPIALGLGMHTVLETAPAGVVPTFTDDCAGGQLVVDGTAPALTCTVTNNAVVGTP